MNSTVRIFRPFVPLALALALAAALPPADAVPAAKAKAPAAAPAPRFDTEPQPLPQGWTPYTGDPFFLLTDATFGSRKNGSPV